jgi:predicted lipid-binding transport protein (Tim44 family)
MIAGLSNQTREARGPLLTSDVAETGTELPTIADSSAPARFQELQQRDPGLSWQSLTGRMAHVFGALQVAWSGRDPLQIRPYVSDNLFQTMLYWIDLYVASRCRNVTENARILRIDLANVTSDKHYDAITVRLFATSVDYTIGDDGKLMSGSRSRPRTYSEYWTWIRGTARRGQSRGDVNCPNCGAALRIGMAGTCEYCRVKVTAGEFDWVLSRIEQDDSYTGS